jgi:hypothetical protein
MKAGRERLMMATVPSPRGWTGRPDEQKLREPVSCCATRRSQDRHVEVLATTKEGVMLFMIEWEVNHDQKMETFGAFAAMSEADDAAAEQAHGFTQIGRWHDIANGRGVAIVEAASSEAIHGFLMMWTGSLSTLNVTPVLDDAGARAVMSANLP